MIKKELYPKTTRLPMQPQFQITEKLDGSNLCFFTFEGELYIAQRGNVYTLSEVKDGSVSSDKMYKGLHGFLMNWGDNLKDDIFDQSVLCGEWIGMGKLKYPEYANTRYVMYGKARVEKVGDDFVMKQFKYGVEGFDFAFNAQVIPSYIVVVPVVDTVGYEGLSVSAMDKLYEEYTTQVKRPVEGFVVNVGGTIFKYVRMKDGKLSPHFDRGE